MWGERTPGLRRPDTPLNVEPLQWSNLCASHRQRRWLTSIELTSLGQDEGGHDVPMCDMVAAQLVGHETRRFLSLSLQEFPKESPPRAPASAGLDEDVDHVTVLVNRTPEILALTVDRDEDFVQKPRISESTLSATIACCARVPFNVDLTQS